MLIWEMYSVSPDVGLFATTPTALELLPLAPVDDVPVDDVPVDDVPIDDVPVDDVPVDVGAVAGCDCVGWPWWAPPFPLSLPPPPRRPSRAVVISDAKASAPLSVLDPVPEVLPAFADIAARASGTGMRNFL
jgi:hypothetical protein